jgi:D-sedoheptulose 7-phosphate isomerase
MTDAHALRRARDHCGSLQDALADFQERNLHRIAEWGRHLAAVLPVGGRLLAAGNGGSAAQAQHLTAELVGRYRDDRPAYSAIALHADTSSLTAIGNDYGFQELYARGVAAHGRPGDVLVLLSTSGRSRNLLDAAATGRAAGLRVWALTGSRPNPLVGQVDEAVCVAAPDTATVQETHLVALHLLCEAFDAAAGHGRSAAVGPGRSAQAGHDRSAPVGASAAADGPAEPGTPEA